MSAVFGVFKITESEEVLQKEHPEIFFKLKHRINQYVFMKYLYSDGSKFDAWFLDGESIDDLKIEILNQDYF